MIIDLKYLKEKYAMNISGVVHVGAHYGEEIPVYLANKITKIVCFEPLEENLKILIQHQGAGVQIKPYALGHKNYDTEMYISSNSAESSSILRPKKHLQQYPHISFNEKKIIKVKKMIEFIDDIKGCNFLNMDVQGFEYQVLLGAEKCLDQFDYIYTEINRDETYENNIQVESIDEYLNSYNFSRVETDWSGIIWGDAFYIRKNLL